MWMYSEDSTRIHPEDVSEDILEKWLMGITSNKDNPRGSRRVIPFDHWRQPEQALIDMYSMPNGVQEQDVEEGVSGGESGECRSDAEEDEESNKSTKDEEVDSPPHRERRSKHAHDPVSTPDLVTAPTGQSSKRPRTSSPVLIEKAPKQPKVVLPPAAKAPKATSSKLPKALPRIKVTIPTISGAATSGTSSLQYQDEEMEDAVTSNPAPPNVINLPDDDEDVALRPRKNKKATASKASQQGPTTTPTVYQSEDAGGASVTFDVPFSSELPAPSTLLVIPSVVPSHASEVQAATPGPSALFFTSYLISDNQSELAAEAIRQANVMMERMKTAHENSQAAYDASAALRSNVQKSCTLISRFAELEEKQRQLNLNLELAQQNLKKSQDEATEKMKLALEKKDSDLTAAQKEAQDKTTLADQKLASVETLEGEVTKLKSCLNESNREVTRLKKDKITLNEKLEFAVHKRNDTEAYLRTLAKKLYLMLEEFCQDFDEETGKVETGLDPIASPVCDETAMNMLRLESRVASITSYLARLKEAVSQEWKKSSALCGADVALSLVRIHCKEACEDKMAAIKVANTKKHDFQSFMETFIAAATRIADGIDLDEFVEPASPPPAE
ncbi:hypothetical protein VPH35_020993 [Triticum aestivum]